MKLQWIALPLILLLAGCVDIGFLIGAEEEHEIKIDWLGHAGFLIETQQTRLYINPYSAPIGSLKGDAIIVTYSASDLCDLSSINTLSKDSTILITPPACSVRLAGGNRLTVEPDKTYNINEMRVQTIDAYNLNGTINEGEGVGLIITINQTRIYYTGITDIIPEMNNVNDIDVMIFPIAGHELTMNINESVVLMDMVNADYNIPMYYGGLSGTSLDAGREVKRIAAQNSFNVTLLSNQDLFIN